MRHFFTFHLDLLSDGLIRSDYCFFVMSVRWSVFGCFLNFVLVFEFYFGPCFKAFLRSFCDFGGRSHSGPLVCFVSLKPKQLQGPCRQC